VDASNHLPIIWVNKFSEGRGQQLLLGGGCNFYGPRVDESNDAVLGYENSLLGFLYNQPVLFFGFPQGLLCTPSV
jgi:hypothetical protein